MFPTPEFVARALWIGCSAAAMACGQDGPVRGHSAALSVIGRPAAHGATSQETDSESSTSDPILAGGRVFARTCTTCHQPSGAGLPNAFPPLAGSDFLLADKARSIRIVLGGLSGPVTVNGKDYAASMPSHAFLSDREVANVLTFVRNTWGNRGEAVTPDEVTASRRDLSIARPTAETARTTVP